MDRDYLIWLTGIWYRSSSPVIDPSLRFRLILTGTGISSFVNQIVMSSSLRKNFPTTVLEINRWQGSGPYMVFMVSSPVYLILRSQSLFDIKMYHYRQPLMYTFVDEIATEMMKTRVLSYGFSLIFRDRCRLGRRCAFKNRCNQNSEYQLEAECHFSFIGGYGFDPPEKRLCKLK